MKSFRNRLLITFLLVVLLPLIALAFIVRYEMTGRLTQQYETQIESMISGIEEDLLRVGIELRATVVEMRHAIVDDNRFRSAVDRVDGNRSYLLDYAGNLQRLAGLSMLQIQDESGRIISSGHFRNEYDRLDLDLPSAIGNHSTDSAALPLVYVRTPEGPLYAISAVDSFRVGSRRFLLLAGLDFQAEFLDRVPGDPDLTVELILPEDIVLSEAEPEGPGDKQPEVKGSALSIHRELSLVFIDSERIVSTATIVVTNDLAGLRSLRNRIDQWFLIVVLLIGLFSVGLIIWNASRLSKPLMQLTEKTSRLDLDHLNVDFDSDRKDEIGTLSRILAELTTRLRTSILAIKDAERRAVVGDLARQINHDVKNGLTPIRNIFQHLSDVSAEDPEALPAIFRERIEALESSIAYLENLSSNYARLSPRTERRPCDLNRIAAQVADEYRGVEKSTIEVNLLASDPVLGDPVSLRRVVENLVDNAVESLDSSVGQILISTEQIAGEDDQSIIRLIVADTGRGMTEEEQNKIFDDFYTTREDGTGLGLSIVRRLVMDLGGTVGVESEIGVGSRFIIDLPLAKARSET